MKYIIRGENIDVTSSIKKYIEEKLSKMDKYFDSAELVEARVLISVTGINQKVEVTLVGTGKYFIRNEEVNSDLYAAIDSVIDKLERKFRKYKTKINKINIEEPTYYEEEEESDEEEIVVKRKNLTLKPMDEGEALTQMELLGHTFFVFKNVENNKICVAYKRKDGNYGILEAK